MASSQAYLPRSILLFSPSLTLQTQTNCAPLCRALCAALLQIPPAGALASLRILLGSILVSPSFLSPPQESRYGDSVVFFSVPLFLLVPLPWICGSSSDHVSLSRARFSQMSLSLS